MCNTFERHLTGIMLSGESQPPKVTPLMTHLHNRVTKVQKRGEDQGARARGEEGSGQLQQEKNEDHEMELLYLEMLK